MSLEKTEAIVLRVVPWSETSVVVTLFTQDFGKISAIAKGARRLRGPFESSIDLLAKSHAVFIHKNTESLDLLTEAKLIRRFRSAQISVLPLYCGYYVAELLLVLTEENQKAPELYELLDQTLTELDQGREPFDLILRFEMQLQRLLGHLPTFHLCASCGNPVQSERSSQGVLLGVAAGGVLCTDCLPGQTQVIRVKRETLDQLVAFANDDWRTIETSVPKQYRGELRFVMERFVSALADRRLRLWDYLEELKR